MRRFIQRAETIIIIFWQVLLLLLLHCSSPHITVQTYFIITAKIKKLKEQISDKYVLQWVKNSWFATKYNLNAIVFTKLCAPCVLFLFLLLHGRMQPRPAIRPVKCCSYHLGIYVSTCSAIATFTDKKPSISRCLMAEDRGESRSCSCYSRKITDEAMTLRYYKEWHRQILMEQKRSPKL